MFLIRVAFRTRISLLFHRTGTNIRYPKHVETWIVDINIKDILIIDRLHFSFVKGQEFADAVYDTLNINYSIS